MACVKVYLCSNPEESVLERRLLRQRVFPRLREYCRCTYGLEFRVIDPYEAADPKNWPSQQERLQILEDCRKNSVGPFFVGLVGEQYGDSCLPEQVEASEFQHVLQMCLRMGFRTGILERCYKRDENAIPPSFCRLNLMRQIKHTVVQHENPTEENKQLPEVRRILHDVVNQCVHEGIIPHDKALKYFQSSLENDIRYAYEGHSSENAARCLCYVHKIKVPKKALGLSPEKQAQSQRLSSLRDHFLPSLVAFHKAVIYCTTTKCNRLRGYTPEMRMDFAVGLSEQIHSDLKRLIDGAVKNKRPCTGEKFGQKDLCHIYSSLYRIERPEAECIKSYLVEKNTTFPFILSGGSCSGKTVLLAHCARQASVWLKNLDPEILVYFIDANSSLRELLKDISERVDSSSTCVNSIFQLKEKFTGLLTARPLSKNPLVLIIDGLDQMPETDEKLNLTCLPKSLAPNVKLLLSVNANRSALVTNLKLYYPYSAVLCELQEVDSKSCSRLLTTLLQESDRKITSGQQMYVNEAFKKCSVPLYVELLHRQAIHWSSEFEITENTLDQEVHNNIVLMFDHLERKHGVSVVSKALSYLTFARYGMTAAELTDVLSCDDEVLASFLPPGDSKPLILRVPEAFVESLLSELKGFLVLRNIIGIQTLFWVSRHFPLVVCKRYLKSEETTQKIHQVLSDYFSGSWANGTAKPFIVNKDMKMPSCSDGPQNIDRQVPSQPWTFSPPMFISTAIYKSAKTQPNLRKLHRLAFHLLKSERIEDLGNQMMSQEYLQEMLQAKLADELFLWLERTSQLVYPRELQLLHGILRSSACLLRENPADLPTVLEAKLRPFLSVFPTLEECVNLAGSEGMIQKNRINTVWPPVPSVPYSYCTLEESPASQITHSAGSPCGSVVAVLDSGAAWVCDGGVFEGFKLIQSSNLQFTSVCSSENTFLLSTHTGKLVLWEAGINAQPLEIQTQQKEKHKNPILAGVLVSDDKIFVWWKGQKIVSIYVEREEHTQVSCPNEITCVSCSEFGDIIYCGQNESSVTIFDWSSGQLLATFTCPRDMPLTDMILSEDEGMLSCVDQTGNVFAWSLETITEPFLYCESHSRTQGKVLNTDYKGDDILLICKMHQIQLIDMHQTKVLDKFNPPRCKTFKQAIMDQNAHFILALLCNCPFLLVWNCASGQCVLSLDTANCEAIKLLKCGSTYLAALTSVKVLFWDMDLITASAMAPKSGKQVEMIAVGSHGESCYSTDGSRLVWKWAISNGKVEGHFLHQGSVESMSISFDGNYLVSIARGEIYVWETRGENIYRISGSQAYKVLITKGNLGVAVSETGSSRVWKLQSGHIICSIHFHLKNAVISPESTFLFGLNGGNLLAVSLWSGNVSKCFSCFDQSDVFAFHTLLDHPEFVIVASALGAVYSWKVTEDTTCHQFQLPNSSLCQPDIFRLPSKGGYAILSISKSTINILDFSNIKLCSLKTEGPVLQPYAIVGLSGQYLVYTCFCSSMCHNISCDFHEKPMLVAIRLTDGETVGRFYLCKNPSTLTVSDDLVVYVGFEDGSVGVYSVDTKTVNRSSKEEKLPSPTVLCPLDEQLIWPPLQENPTEENKQLPEVRRILHDVVNQCVHEGIIPHDKALKYFQSSLENDIRYAYEGHSSENAARCLCYVHKIKVPKKALGLSPEKQAQSQRLSSLRDHFLPSLVAFHKAVIYSTTTKCNRLRGYTPEMRMDFAVGLSEQIHSDLKRLIDGAVKNKRPCTGEKFGQKDLCHIYSSLYSIERPEAECIKSYLVEKNTTFPFILSGGSCSGKTVLLAHCARQASVWLKNLDPEILVYFIDANSSLRELLKDISERVDSSSTCVNSIFQLKEKFTGLLTARPLSKNPLVLIIDGLDQMPETDEKLNLTCLPKSLAPNVKLLLSVNANRSALVTNLKLYYPYSAVLCELQEVDSKSCSRLLTTLLQESDRKITSGQQMYVNEAFKKCSVPLYVELLHRQAIHWNSEFEITENTLDQEVHNNIVLMFDHLERKHGVSVVSKALSYLTFARYGMTAAELTDVLSCDDEVLASFLPPGDSKPLILRVPEAFVESLLSELKGFLVLRNIIGIQTLFWVSRHFPLVVCKRYLKSEETTQKIHQVLSDYFSGSWANGTAKPFIVNKDMKMPSCSDGPQNIDRQVPSQPWTFSPPMFISTAIYKSAKTQPNLRKLHRLAFHLLKSERIEDLGNQMMSQEYLQEMLQAKLADELFLWLERTSQLVYPRELQLLHGILRSSACLLRENPADLPTVLEAKLRPFLSVFPTLEECVNLAGSEGMIQKNRINTVWPPVPSVPYSYCTLEESPASQITHSAGSPCGSVVAVLDSGAAWVCDGGVFEGFKLIQSSNLQFTSVCSSENTFLLSTHTGKLVLWEAGINAQPLEIQTQQKEKHKNPILAGVLVSDDKIFVWWKGQKIVSIYVEREEHTQVSCPNEITCVSCSEFGDIIYCGQNESSVTIFDWSSGQLLATFTCPRDMPLTDMILSEDEGMLSCVDQTGNVFAWSLETITEPFLYCESHSRTQGKVLNTDYKGDDILLICKMHQIQLIDMHQTKVLDKFNPPRCKTFKQAIMDQNAHFILALLCNCPFLLVWNCASGQCVLSLDTANCEAIKLLKCGSTYLAALTSVKVLFWDMDLITASAMAPKSGKQVEMIAVGSHGESCYSTDGSRLVWKWAISNGKVEGHFLHQGSVESMSISFDGNYLVSIARGEIYVWETRGENIYRISGSQAYKVLITKGNLGVAVSETGSSRVWKLQSGHIICSIHFHLKNAVISPESTFLFGLNGGNLLAVSLWSGNVSKCFSCFDQSDVFAFHTLLDHPEFVIVASALGAVYSWKVTEDTTCHQFQLPNSSLCQPDIFRLPSKGGYAILSISKSTINILDFSNIKLCSLKTEGPVLQPYAIVGLSGQYLVYTCFCSSMCHNISCDFHEKPMLVAIRLTDGETVGRFYLCKNPSTLTVSDDLVVYVGFEDGSVGVYSVDTKTVNRSSKEEKLPSPTVLCPLDEQLIWPPLVKPNLTWHELPLKLS